jgi:hypothetical protein
MAAEDPVDMEEGRQPRPQGFGMPRGIRIRCMGKHDNHNRDVKQPDWKEKTGH